MSENQTQAVALTKEEKIARIDAQIAKLQQRRDDVLNDRVTVKAKAAAYVPAVGDKVLATVGRKTATTNPTIEEGTVVAVKAPNAGEKGSVQVRVRIKEGQFEEQVVTLYPTQLVPNNPEPVAEGEAAAE